MVGQARLNTILVRRMAINYACRHGNERILLLPSVKLLVIKEVCNRLRDIQLAVIIIPYILI